MKKIYLIIACGLAFAACKNTGGSFKKGTEGIEYKIINEGSGETLQKGQYLEFHASTLLNHNGKDSLLSSTREVGGAQIVKYDSTVLPPAYYKIFAELKKGDSLVTKVMTDSVFKVQPDAMPPFMHKGDYIYTTLRAINIYKTEAEAEAARKISDEITRTKVEANTAKQLKEDQDKLLAYFAKNKIQTVKTPAGAFVQIITPGTGPLMDTTNFAKVNYTGSVLEGAMFDSNTDPSKGHVEPLLVNVTKDMSLGNPSIEGFSDGLRQLNKGAKAKIYIPSAIGYGKQGMGPQIPPNSNLVFDVEVVDILTKEQAKADQAASLAKLKAMQKRYSDSIAKLPQPAPQTPTEQK